MRAWLLLAAVNGFLGVAMGAYGAHRPPGAAAGTLLQTAAAYQLFHAAALLALAGLHARAAGWPRRLLAASGALFAAGVLLFSGGLYATALAGRPPLPGMAPTGGVLLLLGWLGLGVAAFVWRRP